MINKKKEIKKMSKPKTPINIATKANQKQDEKAKEALEIQKKMKEKAEEGCPFC